MLNRRRVLVARSDNLGDVLLTGPAVRAVAASGCEVHYLCSPQGRPAASVLPGVSSVLVGALPWIDASPPRPTRAWTEQLVDRLAAVGADEALIFTSFHQSALPLALVMRMAGIGRISAISVEYPGSLLDVRHTVDDDIHEVERALSLSAAAGFRLPGDDDRRLRIRLKDRQVGGILPADWADEGYVVLHPGASVPARAWSPQGNAELVAALTSADRRIALTGAGSEGRMTADLARRAATPERVRDMAGRTSFTELATLIAGADALVCGNTGPAHLAAAVGTPVVSIYAPTVPAVRWHPWMVPHVILGRQDIGCAGCRARVCPVAGHPCVGGIEVDSVLAAVEAVARPTREPEVGPRELQAVHAGGGKEVTLS